MIDIIIVNNNQSHTNEEGKLMSNEEYVKCIMFMVERMGNNWYLKIIFEFVHKLFVQDTGG